ncbi:MAG: hypothetical protein HKN94_00500 [Acidimicrobiales bacterium]|nr:hypothetical protein [Acidimicrobiales bacterium]RZV48453.1 MAG: hypothetical protein EX269_01825 [Acidimicrobiales bacterium]
MMIAAVGDTGYNIVLILHILTAMAAFAPAFAHPFLSEQSKSLDSANQSKLLGFIAANGRRIYAPALIVTGLLGFGLAGMSDSVFKMSQGWLMAAAVVWIAMNGVLHAIVLPSERKWADGDSAAEQKVMIGGITITVLLLVMLYLMIFKPGL